MSERRHFQAPRQVCVLVVLAAVFAGGIGTLARAQGPAAGASIEAACGDKTSNVEITACMAEFAAKVDRDLNALWPRVLASIDAASNLNKTQRADWKAKLTAAQRHWIAFKTADCREPVGYEWFGGTGMSSAVSACLAKHTLDRMQDLKARYLDR
jgi:uncharacterized protein YecT (DUF1311 family)